MKDRSLAMVDISAKPATARRAIAEGIVRMKPETITRIRNRNLDKGDAIVAAKLAGIMGAKQTSLAIPLCHNLPLDTVTVDIDCMSNHTHLTITAECRANGQTGVEMEALSAVSLAALTLYDMTKAYDDTMTIENIRLVLKTGGQKNRKDQRRGRGTQ